MNEIILMEPKFFIRFRRLLFVKLYLITSVDYYTAVHAESYVELIRYGFIMTYHLHVHMHRQIASKNITILKRLIIVAL